MRELLAPGLQNIRTKNNNDKTRGRAAHLHYGQIKSIFIRILCFEKSNVNFEASSFSLRVFLDIWWEENACSYWVQYNTKQNTMCEIQNKTSCKTWHILICTNSAPELTFITKNWIWIFEGQNFLINLKLPGKCHSERDIVYEYEDVK